MSRLRNIGRLRAGGGGAASVDADAAAWATAVTANGGTYSAGTLTAVDTFVKAAKASNYWSKLNRINLFCGDQLAAALVPLKVGGGSATDTNVNFVGGDYTESTGLKGNGSTKYLDTGLSPSASLVANDTHLAFYDRASVAATEGVQIGSGDASGQFLTYVFSDIAYSDQYAAGTGRVSAAVVGPYGFVVGSRTASNAHAIYKGGSSIASNATTSGTLTARSVYVFARNQTGTADLYTSHPLAAYSIGSSLTAGDVTAYNTHIEAFQDALGRGVQ